MKAVPKSTSPRKRGKGKAGKGAVAENLAQACAWENLPRSALQWARNEGCPAFKGHRVHMAEFRQWWKENSARMQDQKGLPSKDVLDRMMKLDRIERDRKDDAIKAGKYIPLDTVLPTLQKLGVELRSALQTKLEHELPPHQVGKDEITIRQQNAKAVDEICQIFSVGTQQWTGPAPEWSYEI